MGDVFRRLLSNPQCVGFVDPFNDLFGLLNTPDCFTRDMQEIAMPSLLGQLTGLRGQLSDCVDGVDNLSGSAVGVGISASLKVLHLPG
ncbi:MAG: hypothetical protein N0E39_14270 [Candidatus Thiodiazotropha lotti]|nr:hypothetical protein [Candidatus Thiodiazotropha lotti]